MKNFTIDGYDVASSLSKVPTALERNDKHCRKSGALLLAAAVATWGLMFSAFYAANVLFHAIMK